MPAYVPPRGSLAGGIAAGCLRRDPTKKEARPDPGGAQGAARGTLLATRVTFELAASRGKTRLHLFDLEDLLEQTAGLLVFSLKQERVGGHETAFRRSETGRCLEGAGGIREAALVEQQPAKLQIGSGVLTVERDAAIEPSAGFSGVRRSAGEALREQAGELRHSAAAGRVALEHSPIGGFRLPIPAQLLEGGA